MVQSGRRSRHRHSVLSRSSPPDEAREEDDVRRRGRNLARMHGHPPSRGRPRHSARLPAAAPSALAATVRPVVETLPALLPAQSGQQALRPASAAVVRAEPPGRGFRRDLCGVAAAALELADAICRLAGTEEARICRRADGRDRGKAAADHDAGACRYAGSAQPDAGRALQEEAGVLRLYAPQDLRPRSLPAVFSRSTASPLKAGFGADQAPSRPDQAIGRAMDGREPAYARCRARRDDLPLPRARPARRRPRTEACSRFHRPRDRQDDAHACLARLGENGSRYETSPYSGAHASGLHAPGLLRRIHRAGDQCVENGIRRGEHLARGGP